MKTDDAQPAPGGRCADSISPAQRNAAAQLADDVAEFVRRGGKVQKLRNGEFGEKWVRGREFHRKRKVVSK